MSLSHCDIIESSSVPIKISTQPGLRPQLAPAAEARVLGVFAALGVRSTITLKTTDTTLVTVDGDNGRRGALVHLPHASPETITEVTGTVTRTPSATVTPAQSLGCGSRITRLDLGRDRAQPEGHVLAQEQTISALPA